MINFQDIFSVLNKKKVRYLVVGGIAVNLYGIERATADIDLVVEFEGKNLEGFIDALKEIGFRPKVPVSLEDFADADKRRSWIEDKGMMVFNVFNPAAPFFELDIFVEIPFDFDKAYAERTEMMSGEVAVPVLPLKQLIEMKEKADRPQDRADVYYLRKILDEWKDE